MSIEEVMTARVITVRPETSVQEAARLMSTNHVSGLPVVDANERVVGMISDGDLILRQRRPKIKPWWRLFFENAEQLARDYRKIVGQTVADVMTQPALVINPAFSIETAAAIMDNRQIRRLPVVRDGRLVGIVSRADLIRALGASTKLPALESLVSEAQPHQDAGGSPPAAL
jgi:CBS domain-containing protein